MGMLLRRYHKTENPTVEETTNTENPTVEETTDSKGLVKNVRKNSRSNSDNNE